MDFILNFSQIGHLVAHNIGHVTVDILKGDHQPFVRRFTVGFDHRIHVLLDITKPLPQGRVFFRGQVFQVLNHLEDINGNGGAPCPDKGHAERITAGKGLFHVGHGGQGLAVGIKQQLEMMIPLLKGNAQSLHILSRFRLSSIQNFSPECHESYGLYGSLRR